MNTIRRFLLIGTAFLLMGCPARSLFPLFTQNDLVFNPGLIGKWIDQKNGDTFTFQKGGEKSYKVVLLEMIGNKKVTREAYTVELGQIGDFWFIDSYPPKKSGGDHHTLSAHILSRIWIAKDTLRMASLESDWLKEMLDANKLSIPHVRRDDDIILTATTQELRDFVLRYADDERAFPNPGILTRTK
ncbi:MAG TPA: hypothetical protein VI758_04825 [Bacteroidota bacterium]